MIQKWTFLFRLPGGHKYFQDHQGRVAVAVADADDSGPTPDQTEDGILFVATERHIGFKDGHAFVPVRDANGATAVVGERPECGIDLAWHLGMTIRTGTGQYVVRTTNG